MLIQNIIKSFTKKVVISLFFNLENIKFEVSKYAGPICRSQKKYSKYINKETAEIKNNNRCEKITGYHKITAYNC